jgi:phage tail tape-measure protein
MSKAEDSAAENDKTARMAGAGAGILAGAQIGTVLLPIPIVGTFTGALLGGLVGTKIGKKVGGALLDTMGTAERSCSGYASATSKPDAISELERLGKLRQAGVINEEEFQAMKAKLFT